MSPEARLLFLPGWGAPARLYSRGLPPAWSALDPPSFRGSRGSFGHYRAWVVREIALTGGPVVLAGHSMGAALAIAAAATAPESVQGLVLIAPAGLPLAKPLARSLADFAGQLVRGRYPLGPLTRGLAGVAAGPRSALAVARAVRGLDLSSEMRRVRDRRIPATVVACTTDTLVSVRHCRRTAQLLDASYRELDLAGGHMWMLGAWRSLRAELSGGVA